MKQTNSDALGRLRGRTLCREEGRPSFASSLCGGKGRRRSRNEQNVFSLHAKDGMVGLAYFRESPLRKRYVYIAKG